MLPIDQNYEGSSSYVVRLGRLDPGQSVLRQYQVPAVVVSSGSVDAGGVPLLNEDGILDTSVIPSLSGGSDVGTF